MTTKTTLIKEKPPELSEKTIALAQEAVMKDMIQETKICKHLHLVPLEISFIRITHPNGYKEQPKCEFYVGISLATALRVRKYFCPECNEIIKAPSIYAEEK